MRISWTASAQASSYYVYRNSYPAASLAGGAVSWVDTAILGAGQSYSYYTIASNAQGSTQSNTVTVNIPSNVCYTQPAGNLMLGWTSENAAFNQGQLAASLRLPISDDSGKPMRGTATVSSGTSWLTVDGSSSYTWTTPETVTVTFNPTGLAAATYFGSITVSSPQASNGPIVVQVSMKVSAPLLIATSPGLPDAYGGQPYSVTLQATGGTGLTWTLSSGTLPTGLSLNSSTGVISGVPGSVSGASTETVNISVQDSYGISRATTSRSPEETLHTNGPPPGCPLGSRWIRHRGFSVARRPQLAAIRLCSL